MSKSASTVFLKEVASGEQREAVLCEGIQRRHLADVDEIWHSALTVLLRWAGRLHRQESAHWNWRAKMRRIRRSHDHRSFAIEFGGVTQGLMIVDLSRKARLEPDCGHGLIYVDYVEVAPWNRPGWQPHRLFRSVGTVFLRTAIQESLDCGLGGRIGLHSLSQAESFYSRMGMTNLGIDPCYEEMCYFEMTSQQALAFRKEDQI